MAERRGDLIIDAELERLKECRERGVPWKKWGPYLSERQWGTVREDYSDDGNAWSHFSHDQARSRAYRWGEDGLAGLSDERQRLCFALALWNGRDPILKERLFGLTNSEGNHGEDVKEYYFYLDSTPTHSYMKWLYKYPQAPYPYDDLVGTNARRSRQEPEYELIDTGVFAEDRYFDVFVEYAKQGPEDIVVAITMANRGPEPASIHVLPTLWFRNTWSASQGAAKPQLRLKAAGLIEASHPELGKRYLRCEGEPELLFTENETGAKSGINDFIVHGRREAVSSEPRGTKAAAHYELEVKPGEERTVWLRLAEDDAAAADAAALVATRRREADAFYAAITPPGSSDDQARVLRQALAGMLWSKQFYYFDLDRWLAEHHSHPLQGGRGKARNRQWVHMLNEHVISMPDKWEYPWYAAWDLAFHTVALGMVDRDFALEQLDLMLRSVYQHPNGQIPAYEWNFSDVNPPVHAWAVLFLHKYGGPLEHDFLRGAFDRLLMNFTWWVNRKDPAGHNLFEGGFLGLDNIGLFDRSAALPGGGTLEQADGTAWMAFYSQTMMALALELAAKDPMYEDMAAKLLEHFLWIAGAMDRVGETSDELWDEEDGFFYDVLRLPDGSGMRVKVRSMVGLLPLCASLSVEEDVLRRFPRFAERVRSFVKRHPELAVNLPPLERPGVNGRRLFAVVNEHKLRRILTRMLDESRFLSSYGVRSLSRHHLEHPAVLNIAGQEFTVRYVPAESDSGMFGGNSNWRGPIWFPVNVLVIRALLEFYRYYGDDFKIECPTGSGKMMTLFEVASDLCQRLNAIFERDADGRRPVFGGTEKFQNDPYWRDCLLFYEYFHGDNGAGIGASHQTGWTGLVARTLQLPRVLTAAAFLGRKTAARSAEAVRT